MEVMIAVDLRSELRFNNFPDLRIDSSKDNEGNESIEIQRGFIDLEVGLRVHHGLLTNYRIIKQQSALTSITNPLDTSYQHKTESRFVTFQPTLIKRKRFLTITIHYKPSE